MIDAAGNGGQPTPRENILRALRRQDPLWVPWGLELCDFLLDVLSRRTAGRSPWEFFQLPYRYVGLNPTRLYGQYDDYYRDARLKPGTAIDEWGVAHEPVGLQHFTHMQHPMREFTSVEQVWDFPLPDLLADYRWEGVKRRVQKIQQEGYLAVYTAVQVFEPAWYLRGMEALLMDLYDGSAMAEACLERICAVQEGVSARLGECGFDLIVFGDDVGTQQSLMISEELWREKLRPTMERCIRAAKQKNPQVLAYYHSDGYILPIIEDLIEIGVDVLNPVQPECMDPVEIQRRYGDRLSFWGTIGTQTTMPFGTPKDVERTVQERIASMGTSGGLVIAPTHLLEPEVPFENVLAFYKAVMRYGGFDAAHR